MRCSAPSPIHCDCRPGHFAFENDLRATHELVEIRRDDGGRVGDEAEREEDGENQESEWLFHDGERRPGYF